MNRWEQYPTDEGNAVRGLVIAAAISLTVYAVAALLVWAFL